MDVLTRFFDFGGEPLLDLFKSACSLRDPILYLFIEEDEPWHQLLIKYLLPILEWRLSLYPEDTTPAFEIHGEQSIEVEQESSGKLPEVALLNVFPMIPDASDYEPFMRQYEKFQNLYPFVFRCRPRFQSFVKVPSKDVEGFIDHIKLALGVPSLRFESIALDALRYAFKEIERQAFGLQTQVARKLPPEGFRAGNESQDHLSAKVLAFNSLVQLFEEKQIVIERRLFPTDPVFAGNSPQDNLALENHFADEPAPPSADRDDSQEPFEDFRVADLIVAGQVWVDIETMRDLGQGDQDPFAALQRKILAKLAWIRSCREYWLVLPNPLVAFFPELFGTIADHLREGFRRSEVRTRIRLFCSDYAAGRLHELAAGVPGQQAGV
ncbi:MAG: hypothetical protein KGR26_03645 [Cyanobacteria bacterium REEB65]|nr:hypothetical protein [Cyanobacteria bacterium REEB65]